MLKRVQNVLMSQNNSALDILIIEEAMFNIIRSRIFGYYFEGNQNLGIKDHYDKLTPLIFT